jgi:pimeloyl-ACP methyl ester carboxylesterase
MTRRTKQATVPVGVTYQSLRDGHYPIDTVAFTGLSVPGPADVYVLGNGAFAGPGVLEPFARRFVRAAAVKGRRATVVTYADPWLGEAYGADHRAWRLDKVVCATALQYDETHLVGHSWSWRAALTVAEARRRQMNIGSLVGYTPADFMCRQAPSVGGHIAQGVRRESLYRDNLADGVESAGQVVRIVGGFLGRMALDHATLVAEMRSSFCGDNSTRTAALQRTMPVGVLLGEHDAFFNADEAQGCLEAVSFAGPVGRVAATHLSAVTNTAHAAELYAFAASMVADYQPSGQA